MKISTRYFLCISALTTFILIVVSTMFLLSSGRIVSDMADASSSSMSEVFTRHSTNQGKNLAGVVAEAIITPVMLREYGVIGEILFAAKNQDLVESIHVYDDNGTIIHDGTATLTSRGKDIAAILAVEDPFKETVLQDELSNRMYCFSPVHIQDKLLGGVVVGVSLSMINEPVQRLRAELGDIRQTAVRHNGSALGVVASIALAMVLLTSFILARHLTTPIMHLAGYVGRLGRKDEEKQLAATTRGDEIGVLARELKHLAGNLAKTTVSRNYFSSVLNRMADGVIVTDSGDRVQMINQAAEALLGDGKRPLLDAPVVDIFRGKTRNSDIAEFLTQGGEVTLEVGGGVIPCSISVTSIQEENRDGGGRILVLHDISRRIEAEQTIEAQKERLSVTLRSIGDGVITTDMEGRIELMNQVAEEMTGYSLPEAKNLPLMDVFRIEDEKTRKQKENPVEKVLVSGEVVTLADDTVLLARDGSERNIADSCAPIRSSHGETLGAVLVFSDVTERKMLLQESLKVEKLDSLGILAGGIAHDFNNILTAILNNLAYLRLNYEKTDDCLERLQQAEKAVFNARSLTQQLLTFSKGGAPVIQTSSIQGMIRDTVEFARHGSDIQTLYEIPQDLWQVQMDPGQISQVINNIVFNAIQAMEQGGNLAISAGNVSVSSDAVLPLDSGPYVKVIFRDEGTGISPAILPKIFDPYFTTKEQGDGLGLSTSYSIIKKHRGHIAVTSEEGSGTEFLFYLPASPEYKEAHQQPPADTDLKGGKILVMDDDSMVADITAGLLELLGFETVAALDGNEAISLYQGAMEQDAPFDCVILDLTVPGGMGGKETLTQLQAFDQSVVAIVVSGYSNDPIMSEYVAHGFQGVLVKPYSVEQVKEVLGRVLGGGDAYSTLKN